MATKENLIDFLDIFKKLFLKKKFILSFSISFAILGLFIAILSPNIYTSSTTFIPQLSNNDLKESSISGLASLAGINLGDLGENSSEIPPTLYPEITQSIPFMIELLESEITLNNSNVKVREHLKNFKSFSLNTSIQNLVFKLYSSFINIFNRTENNNELIKYDEIYVTNKEDLDLFKIVWSNLQINLNEKDGFISLSFRDNNKFSAAQITLLAQKLLQKYIIDFKNKSSKDQLRFVESQYEIRKKEYDILQDQIAIFQDQNTNISSSLFANRLERLRSELNISESILVQLANQVEKAKIDVNKDTPVFTVIKPAIVPLLKSSQSRFITILVYLLFGFVISVFIVLVKDQLVENIEKIKSIT